MAEPVTLVTGAPGWLGTRFLEVLVRGFEREGPVQPQRRIRCLVMDEVDPAPLTTISSGVEIVRGDVRSPAALAAAVESVEVIVHIAGVIHPRRLQELYEINTQGTRNLVSAAAAAGVKRLIHISSNSVGGYRRHRQIMRESDPPCPYLAYGRSKWLAEEAVREAARRGELEAVILRPCWYHGPGQPERQTRFFRMVKKGNPLVFGSGQNLRSMSYIDNVIQAMLLSERTPRATGQVYWIADERPYPVLEIYRTIAEVLGVRNLRPRHVPEIASEVCMAVDRLCQTLGFYQQEIHVVGEMNKDIACSVELARRELGYRPRIDLREGISRSVAWCRAAGVDL